jgi:8-oxo-dGTP pyrophosphatase MutT (NUDIX family)
MFDEHLIPQGPGPWLTGALIEHPQQGLLLQLRDEVAPAYPLYWSFFGGHMEDGESPIVALWRELAEELALTPAHARSVRPGWSLPRSGGGRFYIFHIVTTVTPAELVLGEGKAMAYLPPTVDLMQPWQGYPFTPISQAVIQAWRAAPSGGG